VFVRRRNPVVEEGRFGSFKVVSVSFGGRVCQAASFLSQFVTGHRTV